MARHDAAHWSFLPAFHNSACLPASANRASRLGTLLIVAFPSHTSGLSTASHCSGRLSTRDSRCSVWGHSAWSTDATLVDGSPDAAAAWRECPWSPDQPEFSSG